jgi:hypothetical protein
MRSSSITSFRFSCTFWTGSSGTKARISPTGTPSIGACSFAMTSSSGLLFCGKLATISSSSRRVQETGWNP